jgi:hypothetical protein
MPCKGALNLSGSSKVSPTPILEIVRGKYIVMRLDTGSGHYAEHLDSRRRAPCVHLLVVAVRLACIFLCGCCTLRPPTHWPAASVHGTRIILTKRACVHQELASERRFERGLFYDGNTQQTHIPVDKVNAQKRKRILLLGIAAHYESSIAVTATH